MLKEILKDRGVMKIWEDSSSWDKKREEIKELLQREEYGFMPPAPTDLDFKVLSEEVNFCGGKAILRKVRCSGNLNGNYFEFPFAAALPKGKENVPFFLHINFRPDVPDRYQPTEEIIDRGYAVLSFGYTDVTTDNWEFGSGVSGAVYKGVNTGFDGNGRMDSDPGKIMIWAWAASRIMDYAETVPELNMKKCAVVGHSRLGKTALVAGMMDERFLVSISNDSGCSGAAISREKQGEDIDFVCTRFGYWFCKNYTKYKKNETTLPFDQHFLAASIAPRKVYIASADEDLWADPSSEYLSCVGADEVYKKLGLKGFLGEDKIPTAPYFSHDGDIAYHVRFGTHYFSRCDWLHYMDFMDKQ